MPSDRNEPGDTVFTRMPSAASDSDRFFVMLVSAAFDAVYATRSGDCRLVEWADTFTMRAHVGGAQQRQRGPHATRRAERPDVERRHPLVVVEVLEPADADLDRARPR